MRYDTVQIRSFLQKRFDDGELKALLFDHFRPVYDNLTQGMTKQQQVQMLLAYCARQERMPDLLAALQQKRPHQFDPGDFIQDRWVHPQTGLEMIRIPAGPFFYDDEAESIHLDEFWIAKNPVTNAAYKRFLDANPRYAAPYAEKAWAAPYNWDRARRAYPPGKENYPVVLVSWYDAVAFAAWAGMELPTERQWEKAARGTDGRVYPWGDEWGDGRCNTAHADIEGTTPVGHFSPQGDSPYGCVDMAGNVAEWTASKLEEGSSWRVLRGGAWDLNRDFAHAACRAFSLPPADRSDVVGFRLMTRRRGSI